jgi:hypothetical protein
LLVDVKPAEFAEHPKAVAVFGWTARICAARGCRYEVWTGADATGLANVRQLAAGQASRTSGGVGARRCRNRQRRRRRSCVLSRIFGWAALDERAAL